MSHISSVDIIHIHPPWYLQLVTAPIFMLSQQNFEGSSKFVHAHVSGSDDPLLTPNAKHMFKNAQPITRALVSAV